MRKGVLVLGVSGLLLGISQAQTVTYSIHSGWNLLGAICDITPQQLNDSRIQTVWRWSGNSWQAYSPNPATQQTLQNMGFQPFQVIHSKEGFWVYSTAAFDLNIECINTPPVVPQPTGSCNSTYIATANNEWSNARVDQTLTWQNIRDVDTHILKISDSHIECHVYYAHRSCEEIRLDNDDLSTNGRETSHILDVDPNANYVVYAYNFGHSAPLGNGYGRSLEFEAEADNGQDLEATAPQNNDMRKDYWLIYTIRNGRVERCTYNCLMTREQLQDYIHRTFGVDEDEIRAVDVRVPKN
jgi:hypothetical protein